MRVRVVQAEGESSVGTELGSSVGCFENIFMLIVIAGAVITC